MNAETTFRSGSWLQLSQRWTAPTGICLLLMLLALPAVVQAHFNFTTNSSAITITGYTGPGGELDIPSEIYGLPVVSIGNVFSCYPPACPGVTNCPLCMLVTSITIPNTVTNIGSYAFVGCTSLTNVTLGNGLASIEWYAFAGVPLTTIAFPNSLLKIGQVAFEECPLTSVTIPDSVTYLGLWAFQVCASLTNVTIGNGLTSLGAGAFGACESLTSVTIGTNLASLGDYAFESCANLRLVYFKGNAPSLGSAVFGGDSNAIVYYLPGTTGWGATFGGLPAVMWNPPAIQTSPLTQTAEAGSAVDLWVDATGSSPLFFLWCRDNTNLISCSTNCDLEWTNVDFSQAGTYTVVVSNVLGAVTSSPAMLNVIAPVERRPIPGVKVTGEVGGLLNLDSADSLSRAPDWTPLGAVSLISTSQYYFDLTLPLPPQRYYQAWQTGTPSVIPSLDLHLVPAITVTGGIGGSVRVDAINQFGPTDAWFTLDTVTLTNTLQLYFDTSSIGQPARLWRLVPVP